MEGQTTTLKSLAPFAIQKQRKLEIGWVSMGVSLVSAGVFSALAMLNVLIPTLVSQLMMPGYCVILGLDIIITYSLGLRKKGREVQVRYGLIALSALIVGFVAVFSLAVYYGQRYW